MFRLQKHRLRWIRTMSMCIFFVNCKLCWFDWPYKRKPKRHLWGYQRVKLHILYLHLTCLDELSWDHVDGSPRLTGVMSYYVVAAEVMKNPIKTAPQQMGDSEEGFKNPSPPLIFFQGCILQLMVHCCFGSRWFGILGIPLSKNPFHKVIPGIQTTGPQGNNN